MGAKKSCPTRLNRWATDDRLHLSNDTNTHLIHNCLLLFTRQLRQVHFSRLHVLVSEPRHQHFQRSWCPRLKGVNGLIKPKQLGIRTLDESPKMLMPFTFQANAANVPFTCSRLRSERASSPSR